MLHLNTDPVCPPRKPCWRDLARLVATLLPEALVQLVPLSELERRAREIDATHPHFREETPLVVEWERRRRLRLSGALHVSSHHAEVASPILSPSFPSLA